MSDQLMCRRGDGSGIRALLRLQPALIALVATVSIATATLLALLAPSASFADSQPAGSEPPRNAHPWKPAQVPPQQTLTPAPPPANAHATASAKAVNYGLPPGEHAPSWAADRPVNFLAPPTPAAQQPALGQPAPPTIPHHFEYHNGSVQTQPQLYLIYWGKSWENGNGALLDLEIVYHNLEAEPFEGAAPSENSWEGILNQYTHVLGGYQDAKIAGVERVKTIEHPTALNHEAVEKLILEWIEHGAT